MAESRDGREGSGPGPVGGTLALALLSIVALVLARTLGGESIPLVALSGLGVGFATVLRLGFPLAGMAAVVPALGGLLVAATALPLEPSGLGIAAGCGLLGVGWIARSDPRSDGVPATAVLRASTLPLAGAGAAAIATSVSVVPAVHDAAVVIAVFAALAFLVFVLAELADTPTRGPGRARSDGRELSR